MTSASATTSDPGRGRAGSLRVALLLAALVAGGLHAFSARVGLNLFDEGFLWYGVERTLEGRVPFRDFQSYNPGRYWWCAAFATVLGPGILAVRLAGAVFGALGLAAGVRVLQRARQPLWRLAAGTLVLAAWAFPRHKVFESALATMAVLVFLRLLERPSARRHLEAGAFVGLAGLFGRNHLLYCGAAYLLTWAYATWKGGRAGALARLGAAALGGLAGLSPLLAMLAFVPGFAPAFVDSLTFFLTQPTNQALPWPWPWRLGHGTLEGAERVGLAAAFLLPPLVYASGLVAALSARRVERPGGSVAGRCAPLVAATLVGLPYVHHVAVRSDVWHLAQCVAPALLGLLVLFDCLGGRRLAALGGAASALVCLATSALVVPATNPALGELRWTGPRPRLVAEVVAGDRLLLPEETAAYLERVRGAVGPRLGGDELLMVAPGHTTFYPLLGARSPFRDVYFLWKASEERQREIVAGLRAGTPRWVLLVDVAVDGNPELAFRNTNPLVWEALGRLYVREPTPGLPPNHVLLRHR